MKRLKTIDELYSEVKDYGMVITNDVALETALNRRIDTARLGDLAVTPLHLVAKLAPKILGERPLSDLELITKISEDTGFKLRQIYSEIMNFRDIRSYTQEVRENLSSLDSKIIYDSYVSYPTLEKAMGMLDPEDNSVSKYFDKAVSGGIAIIGPDFFNDLDKRCNPFDADIIEIFTDDEFRIDEIKVVGNDRELAENAAALIDENNPADYAIVLSAGDAIADSVRSALYRRKLPFINSLEMSDVPQIRDFLSFADAALDYPTLRVRNVREMFSNLNGGFSRKTDNYLLSRIDERDLYGKSFELRELMRRISEEGVIYRDAKNEVCGRSARPQVTLMLEELDMLDRIIDRETLSEIRFAVENVQGLTLNVQRPESECKGVLIADCKNSVYIDRPVVLYLGMEQQWNIPVVGKRYIDAEREGEVNALRLCALLQQGQKRLYCVNKLKAGSPPRPCLAFDTLFQRPCSDFSVICGCVSEEHWVASSYGKGNAAPSFEIGYDDGEVDEHGRSGSVGRGSFSKSSFDNFVACPRRFMFSSVVSSEESTYTEFGNLIHEFAEAYAVAPEKIDSVSMDELVDMVAQKYSGISSPAASELDLDKIRLAMTNVKRYICSLGIRPELDKPVPPADGNMFFRRFGIEMTSSWCETDHRLDFKHIHGIMDLQVGSCIVDYKTGKMPAVGTIKKNMSISAISERPEFQPLIYLALGYDKYGADAEFDLFYAMGNDVDSLGDDFDIRENVIAVKLVEGNAISMVLNSDEYDSYKVDQEIKPHLSCLKRIISESCIVDHSKWSSDEGIISSFFRNSGLNDTGGRRKKLQSAIKKISELVADGMICCKNDSECVLIPSATMDDFLQFVDERYSRKEECLKNGFPADPAPNIICDKCDFFDLCTRSGLDVNGEGDMDE